MPEVIDSKTMCPEHQAPQTISDVIVALQRFQDSYGDLPVEIVTHTNTGVTAYQDIFYAYNIFDDGCKNISIQSFPY